MTKFISVDKRSKKEQKAYHALRRGDWHGVNPDTRVVPNRKAYDRNVTKKQTRLAAAD